MKYPTDFEKTWFYNDAYYLDRAHKIVEGRNIFFYFFSKKNDCFFQKIVKNKPMIAETPKKLKTFITTSCLRIESRATTTWCVRSGKLIQKIAGDFRNKPILLPAPNE